MNDVMHCMAVGGAAGFVALLAALFVYALLASALELNPRKKYFGVVSACLFFFLFGAMWVFLAGVFWKIIPWA